MNLKLYHYWRSSSSWRVRWALEFKEIECEMISVDLLNKESEREPHLSRSPLGFVPVLEVHGHYLTESVAIIEWLEERFPEKKLFPHDDILRAQTRALVELVNAGIQPLQNLIVQEYLTPDPEKQKQWARHFIYRGLLAFEKSIQTLSGQFSIGDKFSVADLFLIPQIYNAIRNDITLTEFPILDRIYKTALEMPSCLKSHPDNYKPI